LKITAALSETREKEKKKNRHRKFRGCLLVKYRSREKKRKEVTQQGLPVEMIVRTPAGASGQTISKPCEPTK